MCGVSVMGMWCGCDGGCGVSVMGTPLGCVIGDVVCLCGVSVMGMLGLGLGFRV